MHFIYQYNGSMHCRYKYNGEIACIADISTIERLHAFHDTYINSYILYVCLNMRYGVATMFTKLFFTHSQ